MAWQMVKVPLALVRTEHGSVAHFVSRGRDLATISYWDVGERIPRVVDVACHMFDNGHKTAFVAEPDLPNCRNCIDALVGVGGMTVR